MDLPPSIFVDSLFRQLNNTAFEYSGVSIIIDKVEQVAEKTGDSLTINKGKYLRAWQSKTSGDLIEAKFLFEKCERYFTRIDDKKFLNLVEFHLGEISFMIGDRNDAIYHLLRARENSPETSKSIHKNITDKLSKVYKDTGFHEEELLELHRLNDDYSDQHTTRQIVNVYMRISDLYLRMNQLDSSQYYNEKVIEFSDALNFINYLNRAYVNQAEILLQKGNIEEAKKYVNKGLSHFQFRVKNIQPLIKCLRIGGEIHLLEKNYAEALISFQKGLEIAYRKRHFEDRKVFLEAIIDLIQKQPHLGKVVPYYEQLIAVRDSISNHNLEKQVLEANARFEAEKNQAQFQALTAEREVSVLKLNTSKRNVWFAISGIFALIIISSLLFFRWRSKRNAAIILEEKNSIITSALSEKELLLKEIHHRVKNNLQVVSSLLALQSDFIQDKNALNALNEGRNRVRSMALIHQNLYSEENLTGIRLKSYFEKLITGLFSSYLIKEGQVVLDLNIEDIEVDVDIAVPLGLITNELVSNALKHGFPVEKKGKLKVALHQTQNNFILKVSDDGIGLNPKTLTETIPSFGYQMIFAFRDKLNADLKIENNDGASITLVVPKSANTS